MFLCQARIYAFQHPETCSNSDLKLYSDPFSAEIFQLAMFDHCRVKNIGPLRWTIEVANHHWAWGSLPKELINRGFINPLSIQG